MEALPRRCPSIGTIAGATIADSGCNPGASTIAGAGGASTIAGIVA
jgi:hypothetical protein